MPGRSLNAWLDQHRAEEVVEMAAGCFESVLSGADGRLLMSGTKRDELTWLLRGAATAIDLERQRAGTTAAAETGQTPERWLRQLASELETTSMVDGNIAMDAGQREIITARMRAGARQMAMARTRRQQRERRHNGGSEA